MVTLVGMQSDFSDALKDLIELEYDALAAYDTAIARINSESYKKALKNFRRDHERHIQEFTALLGNHHFIAPTEPSLKQWLTKGKVIMANLIGDEMILQAMLSNEGDTNAAYEKMNQHKDKWADAVNLLQKAREDERRHKAWLEHTLHPDRKATVEDKINVIGGETVHDAGLTDQETVTRPSNRMTNEDRQNEFLKNKGRLPEDNRGSQHP